MTWMLAGLAGLAGLFYGMWQRSRYESVRKERDVLNDKLNAVIRMRTEEAIRHEQIIDDLKVKLQRANAKLIGTADAAAITDILNHLYSPPDK